MKVVLTGCTGFVGSFIYSRLSAGITEIHCISRSDCCNHRQHHCVDLTDFYAVKRIISSVNPDVVIHSAADITSTSLQTLMMNNVTATVNLLHATEKLNKSYFIHFSSLPVIGKPLEVPVRESHPINPFSTYHFSKQIAEQVIAHKMNQGLPAAILRIPSPIGPGLESKRFFSVIVKKAGLNQDIFLLGSGGRIQSYLHLNDLVDVTERIIANPIRGLFHLESFHASNLELAQSCIAQLRSSSQILFHDEDPEDETNWSVDSSLLRSLLSWSPCIRVSDAITIQFNELFPDSR